MALYRLLTNLEVKGQVHGKGSVLRLAELSAENIRVLLDKQKIALVAAPPLAVLPNWESKARLLAEVGIVTSDDLINADPEVVAKAVGRTVRTVGRWVDELMVELVHHREVRHN